MYNSNNILITMDKFNSDALEPDIFSKIVDKYEILLIWLILISIILIIFAYIKSKDNKFLIISIIIDIIAYLLYPENLILRGGLLGDPNYRNKF